MARRNASQDSIACLKGLHDIFDPAKLAADTKLLNQTTGALRKGSEMFMITGPNDMLYIKATSPGKLREQETYLLGVLQVRCMSSVLNFYYVFSSRRLRHRS